MTFELLLYFFRFIIAEIEVVPLQKWWKVMQLSMIGKQVKKLLPKMMEKRKKKRNKKRE